MRLAEELMDALGGVDHTTAFSWAEAAAAYNHQVRRSPRMGGGHPRVIASLIARLQILLSEFPLAAGVDTVQDCCRKELDRLAKELARSGRARSEDD